MAFIMKPIIILAIRKLAGSARVTVPALLLTWNLFSGVLTRLPLMPLLSLAWSAGAHSNFTINSDRLPHGFGLVLGTAVAALPTHAQTTILKPIVFLTSLLEIGKRFFYFSVGIILFWPLRFIIFEYLGGSLPVIQDGIAMVPGIFAFMKTHLVAIIGALAPYFGDLMNYLNPVIDPIITTSSNHPWWSSFIFSWSFIPGEWFAYTFDWFYQSDWIASSLDSGFRLFKATMPTVIYNSTIAIINGIIKTSGWLSWTVWNGPYYVVTTIRDNYFGILQGSYPGSHWYSILWEIIKSFKP